MPSVLRWLLLITIALTMIGTACQPKLALSPSMARLEKKSGKKLRMSPAQLRYAVHATALPLSGAIESTGDKILNAPVAPYVRQNTLLWKINGIPAVHRAVFQSDPFTAFIDLWALVIQMRLFFDEGEGVQLLGDHHATAVAGCREMEAIVTRIAVAASPDGEIGKPEAAITDWCRKNPLTSMLFIRTPATLQLAKEIGHDQLGTFQLVGEVAVGIAELSSQMMVYAEYLPKQARWQTELLIGNMAGGAEIADTLAEFNRLSHSLERLSLLAEKELATMPDLVAQEREIVLVALSDEIGRTMSAIDAQRIAVMNDVRKERAGMSSDITAERIAVFKEIERQRLESMDILDRQRQETIVQLEAVGERLSKAAVLESKDAIDHFFYRLLQVGALFVAVALVFCAGAIYYVNRRSS